MKAFLLRALCVFFACAAMDTFAANPVILTFDDLPGPGTFGSAVPSGYGGFQWYNFNYLDGMDFTASGYQNGVLSANNVAFNGSGNPAELSSSGPFDLNSAWLTAAWNDGLQLEVQGFAGGTLLYDQTYTLNAAAPTLLAFNYLGVDEVSFSSSGGINHGYDGSGTQFVMDNLTVSVPEPSTIGLVIFSAAGVGLVGSRKGFRTRSGHLVPP
jgi:hypothetical protein